VLSEPKSSTPPTLGLAWHNPVHINQDFNVSHPSRVCFFHVMLDWWHMDYIWPSSWVFWLRKVSFHPPEYLLMLLAFLRKVENHSKITFQKVFAEYSV
jgi:hypothetical protein